uniref:Uncharacterized protein n=1 Tax=Arundo donax TaxID=35708 RepID=A0A0A9FNG3_ARUDO
MPQWSWMECWMTSTCVSPPHPNSKVWPFSATCTTSFWPSVTAAPSSSAPLPVTADPELIFLETRPHNCTPKIESFFPFSASRSSD